ncbi:MbtH family protein [Paenibacillus ihumii]|uniref:MbtH family protein n=1 Tax=Paenibacillus ihumii TaxID=687436 RepID=UPI0006D850C2|nr:MbtH family protein [Paenibacillus ihumii]
MANPFEQLDGMYKVLVNSEGQHSLWPAFLQVPKGWQVVYGESTREACLQHIESEWTDIRPLSLRNAERQMQSNEAGR